MSQVDQSKSPYFNDYDESKQFYHVLNRPGLAIQTREFNQIQSMFYEQIERMGSHFFEEGSVVIPGNVSYDLNYSFVTVTMTIPEDFSNFEQFVQGNEVILESTTTGLKARVVSYIDAELSDPQTMYVMYLNGGTNNTTKVFSDNETIRVLYNNETIELTQATAITTGIGSKITVDSGVYFLQGKFVLVPRTTIPLDKYSNEPTKTAGFVYNEKIVTEIDDTSLYDNAQGSPNFSAPGAHRLYIGLEFKSYNSVADAPDDYYEIFKISGGNLQKMARGPEYNVLEDVLARRTYDESGNYEVEGFAVDIREHLKDTNNRGVYTSLDGGDESKFVAGIGPGLSYIKGYATNILSTQNLSINKARSSELDNNLSINAQLGYYITVDSIDNLPDISQYETVEFRDGGNVALGTGRVKSIAANGAEYDVYFFDIKNTSGAVSTSFIPNVRSIVSTGGTVTFTATVSASNAILKGTDNPNLLFGMSYSNIMTLVNPDTLSTDTSFTVIKQYNVTTDASAQVVLSADSNSTFLTQNDLYSYASFTDATGGLVSLTGISVLGGTPTGKNMTISFGAGNESRPVRINALVSIDEAQTKSKSVIAGSKTGTVSNGRLYLDKADAIRIVSVTDNTLADVTSLFNIKKNARRSYYDISYVETDSTAFTNPITVEFEYFNHGAGDYFSVDSYSNIDYKDIPVDNGIRLSDVIDFRPRIDDTGTDFVSSGSSRIALPTPNAVIRADVSYYVPRKDIIYIDQDGSLDVVEGESALNPQYPKTPTNGMSLYQIEIPAYTHNVNEISTNKASIKRYTMDDIGRLEDRIDGLEYYVSLSLLEKDAADMQVIDPVTGLNRFKNGFLVDSFEDHSVGDVSWNGYHVAVGDSELRPEMRFNAVDFKANELNSSGIRINNGLVTLDYTEEVFLDQQLRSEYMNVNPYAVFRWEGEIELNPSVDNWVDVVYTEPRIVTRTVTRNRTVTNPSQQWRNNATVMSSSTSTSSSTIEPHGNFVNPVATDFGAITTASRTTTTTTTANLQRTSSSSSSRSGGESVVGNEWLPFMRSRDVEVTGEGHKPETKLNFFFDDLNINQYVKPETGNFGDDVVTDVAGAFSCTFNVPNNDSVQIPVGTKLFVATDNDDNRRELALSYGESEYTATSRRETRQRTIVRTRVRTTQRATVTNTNSNTTTWWDPLAQSFLVEENGGIFVTKLDLFFLSKDQRVPVHVDIREMENGMPTQNIISGSRTLLTPVNVNESEDGSIASTFTFKNPVYLEEGREYCVMIWANSINYNVFVAKMGDTDLGTGKAIAKQPYLGVLFKSQNSSTWTADQNTDLQFTLHRAVFDPSLQGSLELENDDLPSVKYNKQILESVTSSNTITINTNNHNFVAGSYITISGAIAGNGFADTDINGSHVVTNVVDMNTVEIEIAGVTATSSGRFGGTSIEMSDSAIISFMNLNCNDINYSGTRIRYVANGMSGKSIDGDEIPYQTLTDNKVIEKGGMQSLKRPWMVTNKTDETYNYSGNPSMTINASLSTSNKNVSPVIDLHAFNLICPNYLIDGKVDTVEADGSNAYAKYRTNIAGLNNTATSMRAFIDTIYDDKSDVIISCRVGNSEEEVEDSEWMIVPNLNNVTNTNDKVMELEYGLDEGSGIAEYTYFQVMIQLKSSSTTRVPICRNLRILALGT